jgi:uracil-DNA glycosylase
VVEDKAATEEKVVIEAHPDYSKPLHELEREWANCAICDLGVQRQANAGQVVFGEGKARGILFVGRSPSNVDERHGHPYIDNNGGRLLRKCLEHYRIQTYYITNLTACRSCAPVLDNDGQPKMYAGRNGRPGGIIYQDQPPTVKQLAKCAPRLYQEIYSIDPIVIVAMGQPAASFLARGNVNIKKLRGTPMEIEIPGAGHRAVLTSKKKEWIHTVKGEVVMPTEQNQVRYLMIPTYDIATVFDKRHDTTEGNIFQDFTSDVFLAKVIYDRYYEETEGAVPESYTEDVPADILDEMEMEDSEDG